MPANLPSLPTRARSSSAISPSALSRAFGPCTATIDRSERSRTSISNAAACRSIHAMSLSRVAALTTIRNQSRSEEHTSELQSLMRISYAVFCFKKKHTTTLQQTETNDTNHTIESQTQDKTSDKVHIT